MSKTFALSAAVLGLALGTAGIAAAQSMSPMPPAGQGSGGAQTMQGMCGGASGTCGSMAMPMQGQGAPPQGMMQGGCPMMRRMAMLDERLRRLEERGGAAPSPQQDMSPSAPR
jgi:hypothetical protein